MNDEAIESELVSEVRELRARLMALEARLEPREGRDVWNSPQGLLLADPGLEMFAEALRLVPGAATSQSRRRIIIPIHLPKVAHIASLFAAAPDVHDEGTPSVTFLLGSIEEREAVQAFIEVAKPALPAGYEVISAQEVCTALSFEHLKGMVTSNDFPGIINLKKLLGLSRSVITGDDEVVIMDSDAMFIGSISAFFDDARAAYHSKQCVCLYAPGDLVQEVINQSACVFYSPADSRALGAWYGGSKFSWFFDAPYYPSDAASGFLAHLAFVSGGLERALGRLTWHTFDHVLFTNYRMLRNEAKILDARRSVNVGTISDELSIDDIVAIKRDWNRLPTWVPLSSLVADVSHPVRNQMNAVIHLDRLRAL